MSWYKRSQQVSLYQQLMALRSEIVIEAQIIYNDWGDEELLEMNKEIYEDGDPYGGGGICDDIAREIGGVISMNIPDVEIREGGHEGDEHNWVIVSRNDETYGVDIPHGLYETGGGYSWTKIPGVRFSPDDVEIWRI